MKTLSDSSNRIESNRMKPRTYRTTFACMHVSLFSLNLCMNFDYIRHSLSPPKTSKWIHKFQVRNSILHAWKSNIFRFVYLFEASFFVYDPSFIHFAQVYHLGDPIQRMSPMFSVTNDKRSEGCADVWMYIQFNKFACI